jgi:hypothetical protein
MADARRRPPRDVVRSPRLPWSSAKAAQDAVVAECKKQFFDLFGVQFSEEMRQLWHAEFKRLREEDEVARAIFAGGRFSRKKAIEALKAHGLDPDASTVDDLEGHAPTLAALFMEVTAARSGRGPSIDDLRNEFRPPRYNDARAWVVSRFELLWCPPDPLPQGTIVWGEQRSEPRYLTDHELAVISVLMNPTLVVLYRGRVQDDDEIVPTVGQLLDRERRAIEDKREIVGALRSQAEKKAERGTCSRRPALPTF